MDAEGKSCKATLQVQRKKKYSEISVIFMVLVQRQWIKKYISCDHTLLSCGHQTNSTETTGNSAASIFFETLFSSLRRTSDV